MKTYKIESEIEIDAEDLDEAADILRDILEVEPIISEFRIGTITEVPSSG